MRSREMMIKSEIEERDRDDLEMEQRRPVTWGGRIDGKRNGLTGRSDSTGESEPFRTWVDRSCLTRREWEVLVLEVEGFVVVQSHYDFVILKFDSASRVKLRIQNCDRFVSGLVTYGTGAAQGPQAPSTEPTRGRYNKSQ